MDGTVEERLARIESRFAIGDLVARYFDAVDRRDVPAVVRDFVADGEFSYPGGGARGRDELHAFWSDNLRWEFTYHYPHAHVVEFASPTCASGYVDAHAEHQQDGGCVVAALRYLDDYALEDGRWLFRRRELRLRYFMPLSKLSTPSYPVSARRFSRGRAREGVFRRCSQGRQPVKPHSKVGRRGGVKDPRRAGLGRRGRSLRA